jgi:hypothetical protein
MLDKRKLRVLTFVMALQLRKAVGRKRRKVGVIGLPVPTWRGGDKGENLSEISQAIYLTIR